MTPSLFSAVEPREDVLDGVLSDAIFAASLDDVVSGSAPAVYGDPTTFFAGTHPSAGLRTLLDEALGRVGGAKPDAPPVIRLETNLGGGKTHNLIALYHAARRALPAELVGEFMTPALYPSGPVDQLAVFVGTSAGAVSFPEIDGVAARTLWGYLALQLGGVDTYAYVRDADGALTAPGTDALKDVLGGSSSLLLIDELARYLEIANGVDVGDTTLARQTVAFLMALMAAVDSHPRASLVVTTTQVTDAFGDSKQAVLDAMAEVRSLMARQELSVLNALYECAIAASTDAGDAAGVAAWEKGEPYAAIFRLDPSWRSVARDCGGSDFAGRGSSWCNGNAGPVSGADHFQHQLCKWRGSRTDGDSRTN